MKDGTRRVNVQINQITAKELEQCQLELIGRKQRHVTKLEAMQIAVNLLYRTLEAHDEL